ncbi:uncharacterized protein FA14DRAFT_187720 [Meira miltonrushii]|uniref:Hydrophobin n=1 Tax=Meira miltonrushii TaxID=1280837 RepID=A0A316VJB8_9BASI|nr:uncharacterized protein FA14DRAFT_187720 [Meira miltonrushii]PWN37646.1 hypothetical protein FA14DRAFT_187720 [Meira miltonrushii]
MQRTLIFALVSLIAMMSAVTASPMPTAAPMIRRQGSGAQTTAPYTSTIDPSQGLHGNGCSEGNDSNVVTCCPAGYQNQNINGQQSCVKLGSSSGGSDSGNDAPVGQGNGSDNGNDSNNSVPTDNGNDSGEGNDSNNQTITGDDSGATTYTSDGGVVVSNSINQVNTFSSHQGQSTSMSSSNGKSGSNGGSVVHVPVSLVLAVIGAVAIGAF